MRGSKDHNTVSGHGNHIAETYQIVQCDTETNTHSGPSIRALILSTRALSMKAYMQVHTKGKESAFREHRCVGCTMYATTLVLPYAQCTYS